MFSQQIAKDKIYSFFLVLDDGDLIDPKFLALQKAFGRLEFRLSRQRRTAHNA
jgi:hypothetical protein